MAEVLDPRLEGVTVAVSGLVDSLPQRIYGAGGTEGWRFEYSLLPALESAQAPPRLPPRVLLSCYAMPDPPRVGERWSFQVKWRRPNGLMNPHGGDTALWLMSQDIPAVATCSSKGQQRESEGAPWRIDAWRHQFRDAIEREVDDPRGAGVLAALSLGDQGALSPSDWALYRDTGVAHLLSVSGMHVTMFAWVVGGAAGWCWRRSTRLCLAWPAPRAALWLGTAAAGLYALFSGWGVPAQRTFGLLLILALLRQCRASWPWSMSLTVAALVVTLVDPWALTQPGYWLSFGAVALLMASGGMTPLPSGATGWRAAWLAGWQSQWVITVGLAPLTLLLFQQLSVVGLVANVVAIPLVSYAITPLALLGIVAPPLWTLGAWLASGLNQWLEWLNQADGAVWYLPWAPGWAQVLALMGGAAVAQPWPWALRLAAVGLCVPMFWPVTHRPAPGEAELRLPDVGQGSAALIRTRHYTLVFDSGPAWGPDADAGDRVLLPLLRGLGERRIDLLMVSHADQDHAGGTERLLRGIPVTHRLGAVPGGQPCVRGQRWEWDGVRFDVLWPPEGQAADLKRNASSCVLRVDANGHRVLLTGDIEAAQEARLLALEGPGAERTQGAPGGLATDVLVVPHHGSRTSSTAGFVAAALPAVAAIQSGYLNRFGHPREEVVARYRQVGAKLITSVDCGAWVWRSDEAGREAWQGCERAVRRRYWRVDRISR
jgi:competence protein ComEC